MTPNLLDELEAEAKWLRKAAAEIANAGHAGWGNTCLQAAECIERNAPTLADMAKDAARYRWLRDVAWSAPAKGTSPAVLMVGPDGEQVTNGVAAILDGDSLDAAIDATQEGEG